MKSAHPRYCAFRPLPILLCLLTAASLALTVIAYRQKASWWTQDVGVSAVGVSVATLSLEVNTNAWCVAGLPDAATGLGVASGALVSDGSGVAAGCTVIDMCQVVSQACTALKLVKDVEIAVMALTAASLLLSIFLLFQFRVITFISYFLLVITSLLVVLAEVALIVYFAKLHGIIAPHIQEVVQYIYPSAAAFVTTSDNGYSYKQPHTFLIVTLALMAAACLFTILSACFERCGRRTHKANQYDNNNNMPMSNAHNHDNMRV
ncbi:hypothetical protein HKX48_002064 [Thoreauomyces humboldtii]|nr:hypothetical protein HKX48_002064 [Thoreauomyces humboldtii]